MARSGPETTKKATRPQARQAGRLFTCAEASYAWEIPFEKKINDKRSDQLVFVRKVLASMVALASTFKSVSCKCIQ